MTLTTLSMDTRTDLPKVPYATALDMFVIMCFVFVTASMLEFASVHYFTKIGSGEVNHGDASDEEDEEEEEAAGQWTRTHLPHNRVGFRYCYSDYLIYLHR